jgi:hypothetical protein
MKSEANTMKTIDKGFISKSIFELSNISSIPSITRTSAASNIFQENSSLCNYPTLFICQTISNNENRNNTYEFGIQLSTIPLTMIKRILA